MIRPTVRLAMAEDDLTALLGPLSHLHWNREQVYVAEHDRQIVGMVIVWDGGHDLVMFDHLVIVEEYQRRGAGYWLLHDVEQQMKAKGKTVIVGHTQNVQLAAMAQKRGVRVGAPSFILWKEVA